MTKHATASKYAKKARLYLANADKLAAEAGGAEKAGEMVWGAVVLAVKAAAATRGISLNRYRRIDHFVKVQLGASRFVTFRAIKSLHADFYETELDLGELMTLKDAAGIWIDDLLADFELGVVK